VITIKLPFIVEDNDKIESPQNDNRKQHSQFLIGDRLKSPIKTAVMEYIVKNSFCLGPIT
jgi:hypothetical protein